VLHHLRVLLSRSPHHLEPRLIRLRSEPAVVASVIERTRHTRFAAAITADSLQSNGRTGQGTL